MPKTYIVTVDDEDAALRVLRTQGVRTVGEVDSCYEWRHSFDGSLGRYRTAKRQLVMRDKRAMSNRPRRTR